MKFLEGEEITLKELMAGLRKGVIANKLVPVMAGTALRNKGVQPLLDAIVRYLPSPLDVPRWWARIRHTGEKVERAARC